MKKTILLAALLFGSLMLTAQETEKKNLSDTEKILGLSRLWEGIKNNFVYYDQLTFSWDSLYAASIPKVLNTKSAYDYFRELDKLAATVKDGHTFIWYNVELPQEDIIRPAPFTTKLIDGKVYADKVWSSEIMSKGVKRGTQITRINGVDVMQYGRETLGQYVPSSTPQWTDYKVFNSYELTKGKSSEPLNVEFTDGKKNFSVDINRYGRWDIQEEENKLGVNTHDDYSTLRFTALNNHIGLLKITDFMNNAFTQLFDSIYPQILQSQALIIDLRNNSGGNSNNADYILRHLSANRIKSSSWSSRMYIPAHASWNYADEWYASSGGYLSPIKGLPIYEKPVFVLINAGTFSAAEDFCVKFRGMKRGKLIGSPTGGSTGNGVQITLIENVAFANICAKKDIAPDGVVFVGIGIIPDMEATETKESFLHNKDLVLEKAVSEIMRK